MKERLILLAEWTLNICGLIFLFEWAVRGIFYLVNKGIID